MEFTRSADVGHNFGVSEGSPSGTEALLMANGFELAILGKLLSEGKPRNVPQRGAFAGRSQRVRA
jgi:hypothetical protein